MELLENRGNFPIPKDLCSKINDLFEIEIPEFVNKDMAEIDWDAKLIEVNKKWASTFNKLNVGNSFADKKLRRQIFDKFDKNLSGQLSTKETLNLVSELLIDVIEEFSTKKLERVVQLAY